MSNSVETPEHDPLPQGDNEQTTPQYGSLEKLFERNFLDYTSYVIRERAIPDINDGLKPVQRRILQTLHNMEDGRFHKVANVVGDTMKLHPHGDASIFAALVNLANKEYLIDRQGNFGNIHTGDQASAARYIECRLSPLAKAILFNKALTTFIDSYDGRLQEPVSLPAKVPLLLMLGTEGIAVGMATKIMPHNFNELLHAQIAHLQGKPFTLYPDFPAGGLLDISEYGEGNGRLRCRARVEILDDKTLVIRELPFSVTTNSLVESVEKAVKAGKLKISSIHDYTAEKVEVEIKLPRGSNSGETLAALYAFTACETSLSPNLILIRDNMPCQLSVTEVLTHNTDKLVKDLTQELKLEEARLLALLHARRLEQIFIEERLYKTIEEETVYKAVVVAVHTGLTPFKQELLQPVTDEDVERLLEIKIRRISRYDIKRQQQEIKKLEQALRKVRKQLKDTVGYAIQYLEDLVSQYGQPFARRTELCCFSGADVRAAAPADLQFCYHRQSGYVGYKVKAEQTEVDEELPCSEYDRILLIDKKGHYKVIAPTEKLFIGADLLWMGLADKAHVFTLLYRNGLEDLCYVKRFNTPKFILGKEYHFFPSHRRSVIQLLTVDETDICAKVTLWPSSHARTNTLALDLSTYLVKGASAKGKRVSARRVRRVSWLKGGIKTKDMPLIPTQKALPTA